MKKLLFILVVLTGLCVSIVNAGMKVTSVANILLSGGQYYLDNDPSSFGGNLSVYFSPVINFSPKKALVPVFNIDYNSTSDVHELAGGGTLRRQSVESGGTIKYIHTLKDFKLKGRIGYKQSYISETNDEKWGEGLFDYSRLLFGAEASKTISEHDCSLSCDYYNVNFPNYSSLIYEEEYETSIDTKTYTEISNNAGEDVLNYSNIALTLKARKDYTAYINVYYSCRFDLRNYKDQTLVRSDGSFSSDKRIDIINTLIAGLEYKFKRTAIELGNETRFFNSNQNSFDANVAKFIKNFYSYYSTEFSPGVSLYLGTGSSLSRLKLWWKIELKHYISRLSQDTNANYLTEKVGQTDNGFGISYRYPVMENFFVTAEFNRRTVSSNMKYEANYKYNYTVSNYFLGINWQY